MSATRSLARPKDSPPEPLREPETVLLPATTTLTHTGADEVQDIAGGSWITPAYDAAGNMISGPSANDPTVEVHYTWDAWDRLVAVYADNGSGGVGSLIASYSYDGLNRRIQKVVAAAGSNPAVTTDYYYNQNWQVVEETTTPAGGGTAATHYVWDQRGVDTPVASFSSSGQTLYYLADANGNVTSLVDPNAAGGPAVVERYTYDAYGDVTVLQADWSLQTVSGHADGTTSAYGNVILYAGYRQDPETGLYQVENRYYEAPLDTWLSRDPAGYAASGGDLYNYCGGGPTNRTDPTGDGPPSTTAVASSYSETGSFNPRMIPASGVDAMVSDGLAIRYAKDPKYVLVADVAGDQVVAMLLERYTMWGVDASKYSPANCHAPLDKNLGDFYRVVDSVHSTPYPNVADIPLAVSRYRRGDFLVGMVQGQALKQQLASANTDVAVLTFALHVVPLGAGIDNAMQGNGWEATISFAGDAAMFLSLGGTKLLGVGEAAVTAGRVAGMTIDLGIAGTRGIQGILAIKNGENGKAAGYLGEAFLRLLGVSVAGVQQIRAAGQASAVGAEQAGGTAKVMRVTSWAEEGVVPDLNPGRWVQLGGPTRWNFIKTGLWGGKFEVGLSSEFPWMLQKVPSNVPITNYITDFVEQSKLMWPGGWEFIKGVLGQRVIK